MIEAGAKFIVSPGLNPNVVRFCMEQGILVIPSWCNTKGVEEAMELGLRGGSFSGQAGGGLR